jgi:lipocalin
MRNVPVTGLVLLFILGCASAGKMNVIDTTTVIDMDIERYLGKWYEIARFPNSFEKGLVGVTAEYSYRKDGKIRVVNSGYRGSLDGKRSRIEGKARIPDKDEPGKLKVSFFLFFYSDYYILELDEDYHWALVGSSSQKYLWILNRTPQMDEGTYRMILDQARERGYDLSELIKVEQPQTSDPGN